MKSLESKYLENLRFSPEVLFSTGVVKEYKGREDLYIKQSPDTLEKLLEIAKIQSAESSNRIEGVTAPYKRIERLVKESTMPRNRPEQEIAGYRDVLNLIHQSHENISLTETLVLQMHSMLYRFTGIKSGNWKQTNNEIIEIRPDGSRIVRFKPVAWGDTPFYMSKLVTLYNDYVGNQSYDSLILIPLFVLDFLCTHPFPDGNGRIGRLLTLLLLYQSGYHVGKYISLEKIIEDSKTNYYEALHQSSQGWHQGKHDVFPWLEYFYGTLIAVYKEFESRVGLFRGKGSKTEQVIAAIDRFAKPFAITDIEKVVPNVSRDMIRKVLRDLRDTGKLRVIGMGRGALWEKK